MCGWGAGAKGVQSMKARGGGAGFAEAVSGGGESLGNPVQCTHTVHWTPIVRLAGGPVKHLRRSATTCSSHHSGPMRCGGGGVAARIGRVLEKERGVSVRGGS